jgi:hypothetical protein
MTLSIWQNPYMMGATTSIDIPILSEPSAVSAGFDNLCDLSQSNQEPL